MFSDFRYVRLFVPGIIARCSHQKTHYDILNLERNCTEQEVRDAFVKMSKECHPDVQGSVQSAANTTKFIKIMEAYRVLSKKDSRAVYDEDLRIGTNFNTINSKNVDNNVYWNVRTRPNPNPGPYYGFKGIKKVSNYHIAGLIIFLAGIGTIIQFFAIRNSFTFRRDQLEENSKKAGEEHAIVRADAEKYGNRGQLERITKKILLRASEN